MNNNFKEEFIKSCSFSRLVGASVVVIKGNDIKFSDSYGYSDFENKIATTPDTIYRIASISKIIVAMAIMKLVEDNKIHINDDIQDILGFSIRNPKYPDIPITIKMLMTQTSSITDGFINDDELIDDEEIKGYNGVNGTHLKVSLEDLLIPEKSKYWTSSTFSDYEPGSKFIYSNFGCGILACIVEKVSNKLFTDFVRDTILLPLDTDASFRPGDIINKEKAANIYLPEHSSNSYKISRDFASFVENFYPVFPLGENYRGPAGGLFISTIDLSKVMICLMNDGVYKDKVILKKSTVEMMLQTHWFGNSDDDSYKAKGLQMRILDKYPGILLRGHTGSAYGVISYMFFNKETKTGICYVTNGGFYAKNESLMMDCQESTLNSFVKEYIKTDEMFHEFIFYIGKDYGILNGRKIIFPKTVFEENNDYYIPAESLSEGLSVVPKVDDGFISISKNKRGVFFGMRSPGLKNIDNVYLLPFKYVVDTLKIKYEKIDDQIIIRY
ncbi:MAG: serine hydrolase [Bacilli bacterium]